MKSDFQKCQDIDWEFSAAKYFLNATRPSLGYEYCKELDGHDAACSSSKSLGDFDNIFFYLEKASLNSYTTLTSHILCNSYLGSPRLKLLNDPISKATLSKVPQSRTGVLKNVEPKVKRLADKDLEKSGKKSLLEKYESKKASPFSDTILTEQWNQIMKKLHSKLSVESNLMDITSTSLSSSESDMKCMSIHVFVDLSNINIGFYQKLKTRLKTIHKDRAKYPHLSFWALCLIMERGRMAARRVLVGSRSLNDCAEKCPIQVEEAKLCQYEINILKRISNLPAPKCSKANKKFMGQGEVHIGYNSSNSSNCSHLLNSTSSEQGVDELLHMKILETLVDYETPSTIVLATGDAAESEYSRGFFRNVERALRKGWRVEIVSWSNLLSSKYQNKKFLARWQGAFKIIRLDDYFEEILSAGDMTRSLGLSYS